MGRPKGSNGVATSVSPWKWPTVFERNRRTKSTNQLFVKSVPKIMWISRNLHELVHKRCQADVISSSIEITDFISLVTSNGTRSTIALRCGSSRMRSHMLKGFVLAESTEEHRMEKVFMISEKRETWTLWILYYRDSKSYGGSVDRYREWVEGRWPTATQLRNVMRPPTTQVARSSPAKGTWDHTHIRFKPPKNAKAGRRSPKIQSTYEQ